MKLRLTIIFLGWSRIYADNYTDSMVTSSSSEIIPTINPPHMIKLDDPDSEHSHLAVHPDSLPYPVRDLTKTQIPTPQPEIFLWPFTDKNLDQPFSFPYDVDDINGSLIHIDDSLEKVFYRLFATEPSEVVDIDQSTEAIVDHEDDEKHKPTLEIKNYVTTSTIEMVTKETEYGIFDNFNHDFNDTSTVSESGQETILSSSPNSSPDNLNSKRESLFKSYEHLITPLYFQKEDNGQDFNYSVYYSKRPWLVIFYKDTCFYSRAYSEKFIQLVNYIFTESRTWKEILKIGAVNCNNQQEVQICKQQAIDAYPTLKFYRPWLSSNKEISKDEFRGITYTDTRKLPTLANYILDFLTDTSKFRNNRVKPGWRKRWKYDQPAPILDERKSGIIAKKVIEKSYKKRATKYTRGLSYRFIIDMHRIYDLTMRIDKKTLSPRSHPPPRKSLLLKNGYHELVLLQKRHHLL